MTTKELNEQLKHLEEENERRSREVRLLSDPQFFTNNVSLHRILGQLHAEMSKACEHETLLANVQEVCSRIIAGAVLCTTKPGREHEMVELILTVLDDATMGAIRFVKQSDTVTDTQCS